MMQPPLPQTNHSLGGFAAAQEDARQIDVDDGLPLLETQLAGDFAVLGLDEQTVPQDAGVRDAAVEPAEVRDDAIESADDFVLYADVRRVRLGAYSEPSASVADRTSPLVEVEQSEVGAACGEAPAIAAPSPRPAPVMRIVLPRRSMRHPERPARAYEGG